MIRLTAIFDDGGVRDWLRRAPDIITGKLSDAVQTVAMRLEQRLREFAPIGKETPGGRPPGSLRASIRAVQDGDLNWTFRSVDHGEFVIGGTRPHQIVPKRPDGVLSFFWEKLGTQAFFRSVLHPGTRPNDFRVPALAAVLDDAGEALYEVAQVFESITA